MTKAEKLYNQIGNDLFDRAEAYYYKEQSQRDRIEHCLNFIKFINKYKLNECFIWEDTEEGYDFWSKLHESTIY